jgi:DNA-binding GntR family transcriptional regulator
MALTIDGLQHKPLKEEIFEALHQRIISGTYSPGEWLRQEEIASQMGVSMTPVREALDLLAASGLAERVPYRGVRVVELSSREIIEAYGKRLLLECLSARLAAARITPEELSRLQETINQMQSHDSLRDLSRSRQLSREFHLSVVRAAGDALLLKLYGIVANSFPDWMLYEAMFHHPELLASSLAEEHKEHQALVHALGKHDARLAARCASEHILHMGAHLETFLGVSSSDLQAQEKSVFPFIQDTKEEAECQNSSSPR